MLPLLDEDEVGTCKDEKHAEHENIAAGFRWHDIKGRSRRRRGANANKIMFQLHVLSSASECACMRAGRAGLILLLCSIAFFISSDDVKTHETAGWPGRPGACRARSLRQQAILLHFSDSHIVTSSP